MSKMLAQKARLLATAQPYGVMWTTYWTSDARGFQILRDYYSHVRRGWGTAHTPHFHAYYQDHVGIYDIDKIERLAGSLPRRQRRLVLAWAELQQEELLSNWQRLQEGRPAIKIEPLK